MWALLIQSKMFKMSAGVMGGSGLMAFMIGYVDMKDKDIRSYVDIKNKIVINETDHIKENQKQMLEMLNKIDNRIYELKGSE